MARQDTGCVPATVAALVTRASSLLVSALAPATTSQYQRAWSRFEHFSRSVLNTEPFPATPSAVALFISHLVSPPNSVAPSTIATYISALAYVHKIQGSSDPTAHFIIKKILKGASRASPSSDLSVPVTPPMLVLLIGAVTSIAASSYESCLIQAMFTTMFHGFLRIGEVTTSVHNIQRHQVAIIQNSVSITFLSYKHHLGQPFTLSIPSSSSTSVCPVVLLTRYLHLRRGNTGPLFCHINMDPIQPAKFRELLHMAVVRANLASSHITPHSFRIGAATFAAAQGASSQQIQAMGRWKSSAYQKYIRVSSISIP